MGDWSDSCRYINFPVRGAAQLTVFFLYWILLWRFDVVQKLQIQHILYRFVYVENWLTWWHNHVVDISQNNSSDVFSTGRFHVTMRWQTTLKQCWLDCATWRLFAPQPALSSEKNSFFSWGGGAWEMQNAPKVNDPLWFSGSPVKTSWGQLRLSRLAACSLAGEICFGYREDQIKTVRPVGTVLRNLIFAEARRVDNSDNAYWLLRASRQVTFPG